MKIIDACFAGVIALIVAPAVCAQVQPANSAPPRAPAPTAPQADMNVEAGAEAAVAVVEAFGKALAAADFEQVEAMLDPAVIILESGGAERSRSEYLGHHAKADAAFLSGSHSVLSRRTAKVDGSTVWVASESELHATKNGKPVSLLGTETMVLQRIPAGWKIVHIHWSSRATK